MTIAPGVEDVFAVAEHIERSGARFYRQVAEEETSDEDIRQLLLELAAMEDDHEKVFAGMRTELTAQAATRPVFEQEGDAVAYLRAMTDTLKFDRWSEGPSLWVERGTLSGLLHTAIELEKDSIAFFLGLKEMLTEEGDKVRVEAIIKEEMRHVVDLSRKLETM